VTSITWSKPAWQSLIVKKKMGSGLAIKHFQR
jgi:hypothetical protein